MAQNQTQATETVSRDKSTLPEPFTQLTNVLEFCPWPDIEPAISRLQEMGNPEAIHHIRPFLNSPDPESYEAAVTALEKLGGDDLVDHVVSVITEPMDRMQIIVPFLANSDLRKHEQVVGALLDLLQREDLDEFKALENPRERVLHCSARLPMIWMMMILSIALYPPSISHTINCIS